MPPAAFDPIKQHRLQSWMQASQTKTFHLLLSLPTSCLTCHHNAMYRSQQLPFSAVLSNGDFLVDAKVDQK